MPPADELLSDVLFEAAHVQEAHQKYVNAFADRIERAGADVDARREVLREALDTIQRFRASYTRQELGRLGLDAPWQFSALVPAQAVVTAVTADLSRTETMYSNALSQAAAAHDVRRAVDTGALELIVTTAAATMGDAGRSMAAGVTGILDRVERMAQRHLPSGDDVGDALKVGLVALAVLALIFLFK